MYNIPTSKIYISACVLPKKNISACEKSYKKWFRIYVISMHLNTQKIFEKELDK